MPSVGLKTILFLAVRLAIKIVLFPTFRVRCHIIPNIVQRAFVANDVVVVAFLPNHFPSIELDGFVVMPNHVHGILLLTDLIVGTASA